MDASPYDAVLYPTRAFIQTHPDRLATLAALFGLAAPPPAACSVLELGCGAGGNLLPMAVALPGSTFVGIDTSRRAIERAQATTARLGLTNISFEEISIEDYEPAGSVDYVIAHGVFSWVPEPVRATPARALRLGALARRASRTSATTRCPAAIRARRCARCSPTTSAGSRSPSSG